MMHYGNTSGFKPGYIAVFVLPVVLLGILLLPTWHYEGFFVLAITLFFIYRMWAGGFYFKTTRHKFIIKNYALPFWSIRCKLEDIVSVRIVTVANGCALRVVNTQRRSILYHNPGFDLRDWERLTHDLQLKGVAVEWVVG